MPESIIRSHSYSIEYLAELMADVADARLSEQPPGIVDQGAWTIGHLVISCQMIGEELGMKPWLGAEWKLLFGGGSRPKGVRSEYPSKESLFAELRIGHDKLAMHLRAHWAVLSSTPLPDERYRSLLPTLEDATVQVLVAHTAYHVGQAVIWRKSLGYPALGRAYL